MFKVNLFVEDTVISGYGRKHRGVHPQMDQVLFIEKSMCPRGLSKENTASTPEQESSAQSRYSFKIQPDLGSVVPDLI